MTDPITANPSASVVDSTTDDEGAGKLHLPIELWTRIAVILKHERKRATLVSMALTNSTMYDICIPHLYETIIVSKRDEALFARTIAVRANSVSMADVEDDEAA